MNQMATRSRRSQRIEVVPASAIPSSLRVVHWASILVVALLTIAHLAPTHPNKIFVCADVFAEQEPCHQVTVERIAEYGAASTCDTSITFQGTQHTFTRCYLLPGGFSFAFTFDQNSSTLTALHTCSNVQEGGWCGWGLSPSGIMPGSTALIGYPANPDQAAANPNQGADAILVPVSTFFMLGYYTVREGGEYNFTNRAIESLEGGSKVSLLFSLTISSQQISSIKYFLWARGWGVRSYKPSVDLLPHASFAGDNWVGSLGFLSPLTVAADEKTEGCEDDEYSLENQATAPQGSAAPDLSAAMTMTSPKSAAPTPFIAHVLLLAAISAATVWLLLDGAFTSKAHGPR